MAVSAKGFGGTSAKYFFIWNGSLPRDLYKILKIANNTWFG